MTTIIDTYKTKAIQNDNVVAPKINVDSSALTKRTAAIEIKNTVSKSRDVVIDLDQFLDESELTAVPTKEISNTSIDSTVNIETEELQSQPEVL